MVQYQTHFQYQQLFEPLEPIAAVETITVDKWFVQSSEPVRVPQPLIAEGSFTQPLEPSLILEPFVSDWFVQASEPVRVPQPLVGEGLTTKPLEPSLYTAVDWAIANVDGIGPDILFQYQGRAEPVLVEASAPDILADTWFLSQHPEPVLPIPPTPEGFVVEPLEPSLFVVPDFPQWFVQASEPVRVHPPLVHQQFVQNIDPIPDAVVVPSMDSWFVQASEPVRVPQPLVSEGEFKQPLEPSLHVPVDWAIANVDGIGADILFQYQANFSPLEPIAAVPAPSMDSWFVRALEPVLPIPPAAEGFVVEPLEPSLILEPLLSDWFAPASEPVRTKQPIVAEGKIAFDPEPIPDVVVIPPMDSWFQQASVPIHTVRQETRIDIFKPVLVPTGRLLKHPGMTGRMQELLGGLSA